MSTKSLAERDLVTGETLSRALVARQRRKDRADSRKARIAMTILLAVLGLDLGIYLYVHH